MNIKNFKTVIPAFLLITLAGLSGCEKENNNVTIPCACEEVIKVLVGENAVVRYNTLLECYTFQLLNEFEGVFSNTIRPCGSDMPESFKEDGLAVKISGNVFGCDVSMPNARLIPFSVIKLSKIERR